MIAAIHAEWIRFRRPQLLLLGAVVFAAFGVLGAALTFATAVSSPQELAGREKFETTLSALAHPDGASHGFVASASLIGLVVAVLAAAAIGIDYSLGTLRPLLVRHPNRVTLLIGKLVTFAALVAAGLAIAQLAGLVTSVAYAHARGVPTVAWFGIDGLGTGLTGFAKSLYVCVAWQAFGTAAAVLTRSLTAGIVIVVVWAVPIERVLGSSLTAAPHWLPGLLLEAFSFNDTTTATTSHVLTVVTLYAAVLLTAAIVQFRRHDITA